MVPPHSTFTWLSHHVMSSAHGDASRGMAMSLAAPGRSWRREGAKVVQFEAKDAKSSLSENSDLVDLQDLNR